MHTLMRNLSIWPPLGWCWYLQTLKHDEWLGDNVLAFHAEWLNALSGQLDRDSSSSQVKMFPPSVVEVLCTLDHASFEDVAAIVPRPKEGYLLVPVNDRYSPSSPGHASLGSHWSLLLVAASKPVAHHLDSLGDCNRSAADAVYASILKLIQPGKNHSKATAVPRKVHCLQGQVNGSDCGIYVLLLSSLLHRQLNRSSSDPCDVDAVVEAVCADATPDSVGRFRQAYLDWLQKWGDITHHQEHVEPSQQIKARFLKLFSDLGVE